MNSRRVVFMFSGQGSQYHGMGRRLFEEDSIFRDELMELESCAQLLSGRSVIDAFLQPERRGSFTRLSDTHPAVFMVEVALARRLAYDGIMPDVVLGASLGEFAALVTAGALSAEDALRIVIGHSLAVERNCPKGGMLAILASPDLFEREPALFAETWLAATHFERHFVVSGSTEAIAATMGRLRKCGIVCSQLSVNYAFHSPLVKAAEGTFLSLMTSAHWQEARCPVVSCAEGGVMRGTTPAVGSGITAKPIQFSRAVASIEADGPCTYIDLGPSGTLATFLRCLLPKSSDSIAMRTLSSEGREVRNLEQIIHHFGGMAIKSGIRNANGAPSHQRWTA
ncbi:acyltransferase domain-containing protein [Pendulispora brunnea]|uniref:Acyltransferase domain-containing protein n=1 Tax=Pendulispora brunnea TaxID=2905690 RepID=A0ABZ2KDC3_9BACT